MKENIAEFEFLSLMVNYSEMLGRTVLKEEYFNGRNRLMFSCLKKEYDKSRELVIGNLALNKNFDMVYYGELLTKNLYFQRKEVAFKELEKNIIENYRRNLIEKLIKSFNGDLNNFFKRVDDIKEIKVVDNEYITAEDIFNALEKKNTQIKLGFDVLDYNFSIEENDFVIIAGGTGTGKTSFALNLLSHLSKEYQCVYFNMEMSKKILYKRLCAIETKINMNRLNNFSSLSREEMILLMDKASEIDERKIILVNSSQHIDDIEKIIANIKSDKKLIVILDHVGLINGNGNGIYEKTTNVAKKIRAFCLDYNCTIFGLCQINREAQKKQERPTINDLRDSGELEQSARKVILLHNKDTENQSKVKNVDLLVAKNDDGSFIEKAMKFNVETQTFYEVML